jgi:Zn-dependent metalloprotease
MVKNLHGKTKWESSIRLEKMDSSATWLPEGKLVITKTNDGEYKIAYAFDIISVQPKMYHSTQYIDAKTGNYIKEKSLIFNDTGTGITHYNGEKTFTTYHISNYWRLQDRTKGILTVKANQDYNDYDWNLYNYETDANNYWDLESQRSAVSALWATEYAYSYFHNTFFRHGFNDANRTLNITSDYPNDQAGCMIYNNLDHDYLFFGYRNGLSYAALDNVGHEYMHGITYYMQPLNYIAAESSALNESFSDFFGECVEYTATATCDWLHGGDIGTTRSLISPNDTYQPAYYHGAYWYSGSGSDDYAHINCGVPNRMFYILAHGDEELGINGIGIDDAAYIAFSGLHWYLDEDATFSEAREAFLAVALDYGNECFYIYKTVMNAWAAVGIGDPANEPCFDVSEIDIDPLGNPYPLCGEYSLLSVIADGGSGNYTYEWKFNDEVVSTSSYCEYQFPEEIQDNYFFELNVSDGVDSRYRYSVVGVRCGYFLEQGDSILLSVYPNPASDFVTLEINENKDSPVDLANTDYSISIIDKTGRIFFNTKTKANKLNLDMHSYQKGAYLLIVTKGKYKVTSQIIKN